MLKTKKHWLKLKIQFWKHFLVLREILMNFWKTSLSLISFLILRKRVKKSTKECRNQKSLNSKLMRPVKDIVLLPIELLYSFSVFSILLLLILCTSTLFNGLLDCLYYLFKIVHLQMFLNKDWLTWIVTLLILSMKMFADHCLKDINFFSRSFWRSR